MYSVLSFGQMASDGVRMDAYARAIARTVKPGSVVVDIGSGTGVLALLALRAGARRVHAIDVNPAIWVAADLARENGWAERLTVHEASSFDVDLAEPADIVVSDLRGSFPLYGLHLTTLADARRRWLGPAGVLLPARDELYVSLVGSETLWRELERGWTGIERHGFSAGAARTATLNTAYGDADTPIAASDVLAAPRRWGEIRYGETPPSVVSSRVELPVVRGGDAHALVLWFEATVHEDIAYGNAPGNRGVYQRKILPLLEPVRVAAGDSVAVTLRVDAAGERWAWDTEIGARRFRQATFLGTPTSPASLLRGSPTYAPRRSEGGDRASRVLALMDGTNTADQIVEAVAAAVPGRSRELLADEIRGCVRRYGR